MPVLLIKCQCRNKARLGQGCHRKRNFYHECKPPFSSGFFFSVVWGKAPFLVILFFFFQEIPASGQSLKALTVPQQCSVGLTQPYTICKWLVSYISELHLALSTVPPFLRFLGVFTAQRQLWFQKWSSDVSPKCLYFLMSQAKDLEMCNHVRWFTLQLHSIQTCPPVDKGLISETFSS